MVRSEVVSEVAVASLTDEDKWVRMHAAPVRAAHRLWPLSESPRPEVPAVPAGRKPGEVVRLRRRVERLRKGGMLDVASLDTTVERAVSVPALIEAYTRVHEAYVEKGYMLPTAIGARVRAFEALPEMATFVARAGGRIVAVMSVILDTPELGLPSDHVFPVEIERLRREPGGVCEITNLAVVREYRNTPVFLQLTQACLAHAVFKGCGNMFVAVSPGHARFFRDILQFEYRGASRNYSDEVEDVVQGMRLSVTDSEWLTLRFDAAMEPGQAFLHDLYYGKNPMTRFIVAWDILAERVFTDSVFLREMFIVRSGLLDFCGETELTAIRQRWGEDAFLAACEGRPTSGAVASVLEEQASAA